MGMSAEIYIRSRIGSFLKFVRLMGYDKHRLCFIQILCQLTYRCSAAVICTGFISVPSSHKVKLIIHKHVFIIQHFYSAILNKVLHLPGQGR